MIRGGGFFIAESRGPGREYGFFLPLNFGGVLCVCVRRAYPNHAAHWSLARFPSSLHGEYTDSFITVGLVAEIPELSG